jgi:methylenetetrahydrofolate reductase (NADPH)
MAGDSSRPAGQFEGAIDLLRALGTREHGFKDIGITGYPESHPLIDDEVTIRQMSEKAEYATYIVSQICFDPSVTAQWVENVWARGTRLPIYVGIPGAVPTERLLQTSERIGVGESLEALREHVEVEWTPTGIVRSLGDGVADPEGKVGGFHVFTFNELEATERWRQRELEGLAATTPQ